MIHFVTGKGGVGKTYVSLQLQKQFHSFLLSWAEINPARVHSPDKTQYLDPAKNMHQYLKLKLKFEPLVRVLTSNKVFSSLLEVSPGIESIVTSGKIFELSKKIDTLVVDGPSSGHFIPWISTCKYFTKIIPVGPVHRDSKLMEEVFYSPEHSQYHIVTLLSEMVIEETLELIDALKKEGLPLGKIFVNKLYPTHPNAPEKSLEEHFDKKRKLQDDLLQKLPFNFELLPWQFQ